MHAAVCQLERLLHLGDAVNLGIAQQRVLVNSGGIADQSQNGGAGADNRVDMDAVLFVQPVGEMVDVLVGCAVFHDYDHGDFFLSIYEDLNLKT